MGKHYKNEKLMKFLTLIGGLIGLVYIIIGFANIAGLGFDPRIVPSISPLNALFTYLIGLIVVILTILVALKPDKILPFHWLVLFILGILLIIFGAGIYACVLVIIAAIIGLIVVL